MKATVHEKDCSGDVSWNQGDDPTKFLRNVRWAGGPGPGPGSRLRLGIVAGVRVGSGSWSSVL